MEENEEELKSPLMKLKEGKKYYINLNIKKKNKTKHMASSPITSWQIGGETMEIIRDFIFLVSKTTADGDGSHEFKRHLLLERTPITKLDNLLKSRDIVLLTNVHLGKGVSFPVVKYE